MPEPPRRVTVEVGGRRLSVSNLDKVLYPATETTKGEVLNYYARVGPTLLAHLARRPVTRIRYPNGVDAASFFEKNLPAGAPEWLPSVTLGHRNDRVTYPLVTGLDALTYLVNLASLELHVPQWQVDRDNQPLRPDRLVIDLDPGPRAGLRECSVVALRVRQRLAQTGLTPVPVTSGSKGMQVYAALPGTHSSDDMSALAQQLARELSAQDPDLVVWRMAKSLRPGKVFLDWSQNVAAKTTISPYSLRARQLPYVATPRTWEEVQRGADDATLEHTTLDEVLERLDRFGDLAEPLLHPPG
ncbi:MAG: non-homologous end-joining DNA ligase [Dermatophilaceae bacterium]